MGCVAIVEQLNVVSSVSTKTRGRLKLIERILANEPFPPTEWDN